MEIKTAISDTDILKCWHCIQALRPHLEEQDFIPTIKEMLGEGYSLAFIEEGGIAVSTIGFRYVQFLFNGKHFYIDDLSTLPEARGKGYASGLLDHVINIAKKHGYTSVTLDSGHHRFPAHKLYMNKGFTIVGHHFLLKV